MRAKKLVRVTNKAKNWFENPNEIEDGIVEDHLSQVQLQSILKKIVHRQIWEHLEANRTSNHHYSHSVHAESFVRHDFLLTYYLQQNVTALDANTILLWH